MSGFTRASFPSGKSRNSSAAASPWIPPTPVRRARRSPPSGTGFHTRCVTFPRASRAPARCLIRARARWGVRLCTDSGLSPPTLEGHFRMTNRRRTWETGFPGIRGQGRAIQQQGHSASPRLPTDVEQEPGEHEQRALQSALAAPQGGVPTMALAQHCHQLWRHSGSDDHRSATPTSCFPRPCCAAPPVRKRLALEWPLLRSPSCSVEAPSSPLTWSQITCRPAQPGSTDPLATASPHPCPASETSGGLAVDSLKRPLTGPLNRRKPVQSPSREPGNADHIQARPRPRRFCVRTYNSGCWQVMELSCLLAGAHLVYVLAANCGVKFPPSRLPAFVPSGRHGQKPDDRKSEENYGDAGTGCCCRDDCWQQIA